MTRLLFTLNAETRSRLGVDAAINTLTQGATHPLKRLVNRIYRSAELVGDGVVRSVGVSIALGDELPVGRRQLVETPMQRDPTLFEQIGTLHGFFRKQFNRDIRQPLRLTLLLGPKTHHTVAGDHARPRGRCSP